MSRQPGQRLAYFLIVLAAAVTILVAGTIAMDLFNRFGYPMSICCACTCSYCAGYAQDQVAPPTYTYTHEGAPEIDIDFWRMSDVVEVRYKNATDGNLTMVLVVKGNKDLDRNITFDGDGERLNVNVSLMHLTDDLWSERTKATLDVYIPGGSICRVNVTDRYTWPGRFPGYPTVIVR